MTEDKNIAEEPITLYGMLDESASYTYLDYLKWKFEERVELIKGRIVKMAAAPSTKHQRTSGNLYVVLRGMVSNSKCNIFSAPFDVRLPIGTKKTQNTVIQPDLCVICDDEKLDEAGCQGVPDLIVEILSPNNTKHDLKTKFDLYEEAGVPEYWIVNPWDKNVLVYHLADNIYVGSKFFTEGEVIKSSHFKDLKVAVTEVFEGID
jgi:Uma2 family endonuclease